MNTSWDAERETALAAVWQAVQVCRGVQQTIRPETLQKQDRSPVTVADFASQAVVCRALAEAFPDDPVVGEEDAAVLRQPEQAAFLRQVVEHIRRLGIDADDEAVLSWIDHGGGAAGGERFWTLDPIDGTKGFLRGGQYAVSLALLVEGRIMLGVLGCPNLAVDGATDAMQAGGPGALFHAVRGQGAWIARADGEPGDSPRRQISVSTTGDSTLARVCESVESGHSSHDQSARIVRELGMTRPAVRLDSQAKYAVVARGEADMYLRLPTRADYRECIWDHAGGVLVVEEAGGAVTDVDGQPLDFTCGSKLVENRGVVVTNGKLHERVLQAASRVGV